jgi:hypothetical protein
MPGPLGRKPPTDWRHVQQFALAAAPRPPESPMPVVLGINWYSRFDSPVQDSARRWWAARAGDNLGSIRGGHAICCKPAQLTDYTGWWDFYNQGSEGTCVGFSLSRMATLVNRTRYKAVWLYDQATLADEWPGNDLDRSFGTSVRAGCEVLRTQGHQRNRAAAPDAGEGISAYRWATSVEEIHSVLQLPLADALGAVPLLNSWGRFYPHVAWLADEVLDRLLDEAGEAAVFTDR